ASVVKEVRPAASVRIWARCPAVIPVGGAMTCSGSVGSTPSMRIMATELTGASARPATIDDQSVAQGYECPLGNRFRGSGHSGLRSQDSGRASTNSSRHATISPAYPQDAAGLRCHGAPKASGAWLCHPVVVAWTEEAF